MQAQHRQVEADVAEHNQKAESMHATLVQKGNTAKLEEYMQAVSMFNSMNTKSFSLEAKSTSNLKEVITIE